VNVPRCHPPGWYQNPKRRNPGPADIGLGVPWTSVDFATRKIRAKKTPRTDSDSPAEIPPPPPLRDGHKFDNRSSGKPGCASQNSNRSEALKLHRQATSWGDDGPGTRQTPRKKSFSKRHRHASVVGCGFLWGAVVAAGKWQRWDNKKKSSQTRRPVRRRHRRETPRRNS